MSKDEVSIHILRKVVVDGLLLGGLFLSLAATAWLWQPFERGFFCGDESLMYPYKDDTVTVLMLRAVGLSLPLGMFVICEWVYLRKERNDQRCFGVRIPAWIRGLYCVAVSFGIGTCFNEMATEIAKNTIGRNRPHFFDLCQPSVNCSSPEWQGRYIQSGDYTCTGSRDHLFNNMRKSFLSGHSSWSAFTMIYLALYLERRMVWKGSRILRHAIQFTVVMLSWYCALSRVSDYKHHWSDVLAGYAMGMTLAVLMLYSRHISPRRSRPRFRVIKTRVFSVVEIVSAIYDWAFGTDLVKRQKDHAALPQFELSTPQPTVHP